MTLETILALFARVPVRFWPVLVISLVRVAGEIEAAFEEGRSGWICYDACGCVWLELYPPAMPDWRDDLASCLAPARRQFARALDDGAPDAPPDFGLHRQAEAFPAGIIAAPAQALPDTS